MLEMGTTRVELGVQAIDDEVYRSTGRGHTVQDVVEATCRLKNSGLKVYYHWMPNLPGVTPEQDLGLFGRLFSDDRFRPDGLKIYPTMVVEGTRLESWYQQGSYTPYSETELIQLVAELKKLVPGYVRISRVLRDIPSRYISAGPRDSLREAVQARLAREGTGCRCIRCREYGHRMRQGIPAGKARLKRLDYTASGGREVFLSFEDDTETLFGLLRLRLQDCALPGMDAGQKPPVAVVRELHVYGSELELGARDKISAQHRGLGKKLLAEAETIACGQFGCNGIYVLSGVGARPYYRSQWYRLAGSYMYKDL
jgi:elongator complex protein 3